MSFQKQELHVITEMGVTCHFRNRSYMSLQKWELHDITETGVTCHFRNMSYMSRRKITGTVDNCIASNMLYRISWETEANAEHLK